jgi:hypothetical protein
VLGESGYGTCTTGDGDDAQVLQFHFFKNQNEVVFNMNVSLRLSLIKKSHVEKWLALDD